MSRSFWGRATVAVGLVLYGWSMLGLWLYLRSVPIPVGPDRGLALFRRIIMARAVLVLGGVAVIATVVLAVLGWRRRAPALAALVLAAGWLACLAALWPV